VATAITSGLHQVQLPSKEKECLIFQVFGHQDSNFKHWVRAFGLRHPVRPQSELLRLEIPLHL
jgi:hypothetical protein